MATAQANAAAPLDQLLVDVGAGPLRRWLPGRPGVEFIAGLAGKPRRVGRQLSTMVDEIVGGASGSSCPPAGTSRQSSTRPATRRPATAGETRSSRTPGNGCRRPVPEQGSRWDNYVGWLTERGGPQKPSPAELGTTRLAPLADAAAPMSSRVEISLTKTGKDLVTMSETPITQQAEAAVTRINQLTERMLTADRNAGGGWPTHMRRPCAAWWTILPI